MARIDEYRDLGLQVAVGILPNRLDRNPYVSQPVGIRIVMEIGRFFGTVPVSGTEKRDRLSRSSFFIGVDISDRR